MLSTATRAPNLVREAELPEMVVDGVCRYLRLREQGKVPESLTWLASSRQFAQWPGLP